MISAPSVLEVAVQRRLDRALRADRHEGRRLDDAVRRLELAAARGAVGAVQSEARMVQPPTFGSSEGVGLVCTREETSRRRDLRRPIRRARGVGRLGRLHLQAPRSQPLRGRADPHREGRPLGARRRRRRRRMSAADVLKQGADRGARRPSSPSAAVSGVGHRRRLPGAARPVRRGRHRAGPAGARQRAVRRLPACSARPSAWTRR